MTTTKTAATHTTRTSPPQLKAFSRLASFFSSSHRHHHASSNYPPSPTSPAYRAPPSPTPPPNPKHLSSNVNSPLTQYLFTPNPFAARASGTGVAHIPDSRTAPHDAIGQQQPQQQHPFSSLSSHGSSGKTHRSASNAQTYTPAQIVQYPQPYASKDAAPVMIMDPSVALKDKARKGQGGTGTATVNHTNIKGFTFPSNNSNSHQTPLKPPPPPPPPLAAPPIKPFNPSPAGGIGESPQSPITAPKGKGSSSSGTQYVPHSIRELVQSVTADPPLSPSSMYSVMRREPGSPTSAQMIGPATSVRTSLLGFGTGVTQMGPGGFGQNPRRAPQPPGGGGGNGGGGMSSSGSSTTVTNAVNSGAWSGIAPSSATTDGSGSAGAGGGTGFQNWEPTTTTTQAEGSGTAGSWGKAHGGHGRKMSGGVGAGLSPWTEGEEETPSQTPTPTHAEPSATLRRRAATTESKLTLPFLESFNGGVVREGGRDDAIPTLQQPLSTNAATAIPQTSDRRYQVVITPPPPIPGPSSSSSSASPPHPPLIHSKSQPTHMTSGSGSSTAKPPIPPKSILTLRAITRTAAAMGHSLRGSSSTPNLADRAQHQAQQHGSGWKGKGREITSAPPASAPPHHSIPYQNPNPQIQTQSSRSNSTRSHYATDNLKPPAQQQQYHGAAGGYGYPLTPVPSRGNLLQAQTICDAFMFPKPRFVAHLISPPESPEDKPQRALPIRGTGDLNQQGVGSSHLAWMAPLPPSPLDLVKVVRDGEERDRERDEWAAKASKSLLSRGPSFRGGNASHAVAAEGGGALVNRLRSRTLSGMKSSHQGHGHARGDSKDTTTYTNSSGRAAGRIASPGPGGGLVRFTSNTSKSIKNKRSLDFLMAEKAAGIKLTMPSGVGEESNVAQKPVPPGKAGRLSLASNSTGTDPHRPGSVTRSRSHYHYPMPAASTTQSTASRAGTHARSGSQDAGGSIASYAIRKVRSLCGPDLLSPALETPSIVGVSPQRSVGKGETFKKSLDYHFGEEVDVEEGDEDVQVIEISGHPRGSEDMSSRHFGTEKHRSGATSNGGKSTINSQSQYGGTDTAENADIQEVRRVSVLGPTPVRTSTPIGTLDIPGRSADAMRPSPTPTPSPAPSSYNGQYGIAVGTPLNHPYALPGDQDYQQLSLPAGPHLTTPTSDLESNVPRGEMSTRHRLPPHKPLPLVVEASAALPPHPTPPILQARESSGDIDTILNPEDRREQLETETPIRNPHPYAASRSPVKRNTRTSMNSVEAMLTGMMIQSSHIVSPLGVREAGDGWVNSSDAELPGCDEDDYEGNDDRGLGSSTKHPFLPVQQPRRPRGKSDATMLIESVPPSMYPSFDQEHSMASFPFDTRTFGEDTSAAQSLFTAPEKPQSHADPERSNSDSSSSSSISSSHISPPAPIGGGAGSSSDDFESFQDLFYVPRSRQPSSASPRFADHQSLSDAMSDQSQDPDPTTTAVGGNDGRIRLPATHLMSPLSSVVHTELRRPIAEPSSSPYRMPFLNLSLRGEEERATYFPTQHSVYDTIVEEDSPPTSARSSVEHFVDDNVRLGAVRVQAPSMSSPELFHHRHSTQLSLVDGHDGNAEEEEHAPLADLPDLSSRRHRYLDSPLTVNPNLRNSYLTTASGDSGIRMSISDFPPPPRNDRTILEYYGVSPFVTPAAEMVDPLSLTTDPTKRPTPPRSDTFGV
ncbi:hypothetical protein FRB98_009483 [Tulasnella sp. 332]|nr:hypothetical protein FRB98_009483 [Tulasnella sp. 332]